MNKSLLNYLSTVVMAMALALLVTCATNEKHEPSDHLTPAVFTRVPSTHSNVTFRNVVDENINNYFDNFAYVYNGGGVGIGDINND